MGNPVIEKNKLFDELKYKPHEHQQKIHNSKARFIVPCCGRRFGKSIVAGHEVTWRAMQPDQYIWIVGPTYKLGEKEYRVVYDDFRRKLRIPKMKASYNVKQGDMRMELPWNTIIEVVSAEKQDGLVGEGLDFVCMSEAALHMKSTWDMYIYPALADKRGGAIFPSTPRGNNWYKGLYQLGQQPDHSMYESWRFPTWFNTVMFPGGYNDQEIQEIKGRVGEHTFLQEFAAEFTAREGRIYKDWDEQKHVIHRYSYNPEWPNWLAIDPGFGVFACYDIQVNPSTDEVYIWREYQVSSMSNWEHANVLARRENPPSYRITGIAMDPAGADAKATIELVLGVPVKNERVGWEIGIDAVTEWLKTEKLKIYNCPELQRQMEELQTPKQIEGKNLRTGQKDWDDHGPDAIRYFFSQWAVLGHRYSLEDVYGQGEGYRGSEAEGFFIANSPTTLVGAGSYDTLGY